VGFWTILIASFRAVSGIYFGWPWQVFQFVNSFPRDHRPAVGYTVMAESTVARPGLAPCWRVRA
jgi:hypothetical protein